MSCSIAFSSGTKISLNPRKEQMFSRRRITFQERLVLEALTELGLSDRIAGSLLGINSCSRLFASIRSSRRTFHKQLTLMDPALRGAKELEARKQDGIAQLEAVFKVSCAYDAGKI